LIGSGPLLREAANDFGTRGFYQAGQLFQVVAACMMVRKLNADQNGRLALYALLAIEFYH
jgi:hypothetical protein